METVNYGLLRPVETPDMLGTATKAANLRTLAMQQDRMQKQGEIEDQNEKMTAHLKKASIFGNALESISGMSDQERASVYPRMRAELMQSGVITPEQAPAEYDPGLYRQNLMRFRETKEYLDKQLLKSQIAKNQADSERERRLAKATAPDKSMEIGSGLRKEWTGLPTTKATQDVAQSIERIRQSYDNPSPAGDLALIFNYMKMLDPGSTVREGEFANAQNSAGVPDRVRAQYNKVMSGERLAESQRLDFASQAERQYTAQLNAQETFDQQYSALAQRYGVDPSLVMMKFPEPREIKLAVQQEEKKPGFFADLFGGKTAQAANTTPKADPKIEQYAKQHQLDYSMAERILKGRGYAAKY